MTVQITQGDALQLQLPDESVDLVITSPPYFSFRDYGVDGEIGSEPTPDDYVDAIVASVAEMKRVLKPNGNIFLNLGDKYAGSGGNNNAGIKGQHRGRKSYTQNNGGIPNQSLMMFPERVRIRVVDELGLLLRSNIRWDKTNGIPDANAKNRVRRNHEDWMHFAKHSRSFADLDAIRWPSSDKKKKPDPKSKGVIPGSTWRIGTQGLTLPEELVERVGKHTAAFPPEWPLKLILGWCPVGGVVLDPFAGTGTVGMVARGLGVDAIVNDIKPEYNEIAEWRIFHSGQAEKIHDWLTKGTPPVLYGIRSPAAQAEVDELVSMTPGVTVSTGSGSGTAGLLTGGGEDVPLFDPDESDDVEVADVISINAARVNRRH